MDIAVEQRLAMAPPKVVVTRSPDGAVVLRSPQALAPHASTVSEWLDVWAEREPDRTFLAERNAHGAWEKSSYAATRDVVGRLAQGLLNAGLGPDRPLMVLSENSVHHAQLALAAMHVGIPVVPVSVAYSLVDPTLAKLKHIAGLVRPGLVFAGDKARYRAALAAVGTPVADIAALLASEPDARVAQAHARTGPDSLAKILFTSGSTGHPKGVMNTQRMLTANQAQSRQVWQFVDGEPPIMVDWLPWNHTFGGNYNVHLALANGGTLYIDAGKPMPGHFDTTLRNLREVAPTMYFNVPRGFDLLLPVLDNDAAFRRHFFSRCRFMCYAAAALPQNVYDALLNMGQRERGDDFILASSWGSTETAPLCTAVHYPVRRAGVIGLPVPGCEVKLVPNGGKYEARVRGPNITPGYFRDEAKTAEAFDAEGFYCMGDAVRFADPDAPEQGLVFDGRVAEDFKLASGTWVNVGNLRVQLLSAAQGLLQDAVITGHDRDEIGAMVFLHPTAAGLSTAAALEALRAALRSHNAQAGTASSCRIARALILEEPPSTERGEMTDKGYINQRFVLQGRSDDVQRLYADAPAGGVALA